MHVGASFDLVIIAKLFASIFDVNIYRSRKFNHNCIVYIYEQRIENDE